MEEQRLIKERAEEDDDEGVESYKRHSVDGRATSIEHEKKKSIFTEVTAQSNAQAESNIRIQT